MPLSWLKADPSVGTAVMPSVPVNAKAAMLTERRMRVAVFMKKIRLAG
jgi:hypothetical protein